MDRALVKYYDGGWYYGYLMQIKGDKIKIKPIGAYNSNMECIWRLRRDTEEVNG